MEKDKGLTNEINDHLISGMAMFYSFFHSVLVRGRMEEALFWYLTEKDGIGSTQESLVNLSRDYRVPIRTAGLLAELYNYYSLVKYGLKSGNGHNDLAIPSKSPVWDAFKSKAKPEIYAEVGGVTETIKGLVSALKSKARRRQK